MASGGGQGPAQTPYHGNAGGRWSSRARDAMECLDTRMRLSLCRRPRPVARHGALRRSWPRADALAAIGKGRRLLEVGDHVAGEALHGLEGVLVVQGAEVEVEEELF